MDEQTQLILWRWSSAVQVASLVMIAAFFAIFSRMNPRAELTWWARAWTANLLALTVTLMYWYFQPLALRPIVAPLYLGSKIAFVLLVAQGAWTMIRPGARLLSDKAMAGIVLAYALSGFVWLVGVNRVGVGLHLTLGLVFLALGIVMFRAPLGSRWLAAGLGVRSVIALGESFAYYLQIALPEGDAWRQTAGAFVSASSSFDTGAEWLLVLGSVLAVSERSQRELQQSNRELLAAQEGLRRVADRDPLTTLANRRALPEIFRTVQPNGAMLLFFDLNGFKQVNDRHGHAAGDQCLKVFAGALRESFRPDDHVLRYGGDEFLVVAPGLDRTGAQARIEALTGRVERILRKDFACGFAAGMAELSPGGNPEAAIQAADHNMYLAKGARR
jgi:diguanylate cyclase (GGDEF)-like protein